MKDLRCLFGFHDWEELPLRESRGNLISLDEKTIQNAQLGDMKIRTCRRCTDQHRGDAGRVEMRVMLRGLDRNSKYYDEEAEGLTAKRCPNDCGYLTLLKKRQAILPLIPMELVEGCFEGRDVSEGEFGYIAGVCPECGFILTTDEEAEG